jgi:hypothetical protein
MKRWFRQLLAAALLAAAASGGVAAAASDPGASASAAAPVVEITFDHPEQFTDVKDADAPTERGRDEILGRIRAYLISQARIWLPAGDRLALTFTDIDLAGDFEPWHGSAWDEVRVVKAIYPPGFKFSYTVTDASGRTLRSGTEDIRDLAFQQRITIDSSDPLHYEKDVLSDWMRGALRGLKP